MKTTLRILAAAAAVGGLTLAAHADDRQTQPKVGTTTEAPDTNTAPASPTMKDLLNLGYEVKTVSVIPHDIVKRGGSTTDVDAAMIVLQKGGALATCYTEFTSFANGAFVTLPCTEYK